MGGRRSAARRVVVLLTLGMPFTAVHTGQVANQRQKHFFLSLSCTPMYLVSIERQFRVGFSRTQISQKGRVFEWGNGNIQAETVQRSWRLTQNGRETRIYLNKRDGFRRRQSMLRMVYVKRQPVQGGPVSVTGQQGQRLLGKKKIGVNVRLEFSVTYGGDHLLPEIPSNAPVRIYMYGPSTEWKRHPRIPIAGCNPTKWRGVCGSATIRHMWPTEMSVVPDLSENYIAEQVQGRYNLTFIMAWGEHKAKSEMKMTSLIGDHQCRRENEIERAGDREDQDEELSPAEMKTQLSHAGQPKRMQKFVAVGGRGDALPCSYPIGDRRGGLFKSAKPSASSPLKSWGVRSHRLPRQSKVIDKRQHP
ncbi:hypothetical protein C8R43DRAFT_1113295 [Mycena crocata]|nr:hypothetical protein C8R43DRAFT_1113295 [Mycena crocata]